MGRPKITPDKNTFERWLAEEPRPTHEQMAERVFEMTGQKVSRSAITVALINYGLADSRPRYKETVPWRVRVDHIKAYPVRQLRFLGRRLAGGKLTQKENELLDAWLENLDREGLIVGYDPDDVQGFHYIDRKFRDHDDVNIPIRKKQLHLNH